MDNKRICVITPIFDSQKKDSVEDIICKSISNLSDYDITILSSCAKDSLTWKNELPEGANIEQGLSIIRFQCEQLLDNAQSDDLAKRIYENPFNDMVACAEFLETFGPRCPRLICYLKQIKDKFDLFIFVGYLNYTTTFGMPMVQDKAVLIPIAQDEEPINKCNYFIAQFNLPKAIIYLTGEERNFIVHKFRNGYIRSLLLEDSVSNKQISTLRIHAKEKIGSFIKQLLLQI